MAADDHYVSQTHLRQFCAPELGERLYAFRKSDMDVFTPNPRNVCCIRDGSTNPYLEDERILEEFLKIIEPRYPDAVDALRAGKPTAESVTAISGFIAVVTTCSPGAIRINAKSLQVQTEFAARKLDAAGEIPIPPSVVGAASLSELLDSGAFKVLIDEKYPHAIGITNVVKATRMWGNFHWEILLNHHTDSPFFSSDFPAAIEHMAGSSMSSRIVPLAPDVAVRISPDPQRRWQQHSELFKDFTYMRKQCSRGDVRHINALLVRCAEQLVFSSHNADWVRRFIEKHAQHRIEPTSTMTELGGELGFIFGHEVTDVRQQSVVQKARGESPAKQRSARAKAAFHKTR